MLIFLESDVSQLALSLVRRGHGTATCHFNTQTWFLKEDHRVLLSTVAGRLCIMAYNLQASVSEKTGLLPSGHLFLACPQNAEGRRL